MKVRISATLAINEAIAKRKEQGLPVLPMGFGEAGLPVHPRLQEKLAEGAHKNAYGSVSGYLELREAIAGYWQRRGIQTNAEHIVCGPGSKPLLYALLMAIGGDVAIAAPSWVSYAAQAQILGREPLLVPTLPGQGGVPNPMLLERAIEDAKAAGHEVKSVIVTLPDNPTGTLAHADTIQRLCDVAEKHDLLIISDEIYRDLVFDTEQGVVSPATISPQRTVVTTGLSKNLALGGWRIGAACLPNTETGNELLAHVKGIASEIWSSPSGPIQHAAAYAFSEPKELVERIAASRKLHATVINALTQIFRDAGASVSQPRGAFYLYPDMDSWRDYLRETFGITTGPELANYFLHQHGLGVLPGSDFGDPIEALRIRVTPSLLYGSTPQEREAALAADNPLTLPWIASSLEQLRDILRQVSPVYAKERRVSSLVDA